MKPSPEAEDDRVAADSVDGFDLDAAVEAPEERVPVASRLIMVLGSGLDGLARESLTT